VGALSARKRSPALARAAKLPPDEHFPTHGTSIEAWANQKSFQPKNAAREAAAGLKRAEKNSAGEKEVEGNRNRTLVCVGCFIHRSQLIPVTGDASVLVATP